MKTNARIGIAFLSLVAGCGGWSEFFFGPSDLGPNSCQSPSQLCGTNCTIVAVDVNNCGQCGRACTTGQSCVAGQCTMASPADLAMGDAATPPDLTGDDASPAADLAKVDGPAADLVTGDAATLPDLTSVDSKMPGGDMKDGGVVTFAMKSLSSFNVGGSAPKSFTIGDFNGDGKPDVVVADSVGNAITMLTGKGDGTFAFGASIATGKKPVGIVTGDWNKDNKLDVATANATDNTVSVLLGKGDGTFNVAITSVLGVSPYFLAVGDLDSDGKQDVVVAGKDTVFSMLGDGNGNLVKQQVSQVAPGATQVDTGGIAVGDWNGDQKLDVVVLQGGIMGGVVVKAAAVFLNQGKGLFGAPLKQYPNLDPNGGEPRGLVVTDLEGDGNQDIVVSWGNGGDYNGVTSLKGDGKGAFVQSVIVPKNLAGASAVGIAAADFDLNAKVDIVITNTANASVTVFLGANPNAANKFSVGQTPESIVTVDLNGDGKPDIITLCVSDKTLAVILNTSQ